MPCQGQGKLLMIDSCDYYNHDIWQWITFLDKTEVSGKGANSPIQGFADCRPSEASQLLSADSRRGALVCLPLWEHVLMKSVENLSQDIRWAPVGKKKSDDWIVHNFSLAQSLKGPFFLPLLTYNLIFIPKSEKKALSQSGLWWSTEKEVPGSRFSQNPSEIRSARGET